MKHLSKTPVEYKSKPFLSTEDEKLFDIINIMTDDYLHFKSYKEETDTDTNKRVFLLTLKDIRNLREQKGPKSKISSSIKKIKHSKVIIMIMMGQRFFENRELTT